MHACIPRVSKYASAIGFGRAYATLLRFKLHHDLLHSKHSKVLLGFQRRLLDIPTFVFPKSIDPADPKQKSSRV